MHFCCMHFRTLLDSYADPNLWSVLHVFLCMTHMLTLTHVMGMGFCGYGYGSAFSDPGLTHGDPYFSLCHGSASGDYPWSCISQCALLFQVPTECTKKFHSIWQSLSYVPQLSHFQCFIQTFNLFQSTLTLHGIYTWSFLYAVRMVRSKYWIHSSLWNMSHMWCLWWLLALQHKSSTISKKFFF